MKLNLFDNIHIHLIAVEIELKTYSFQYVTLTDALMCYFYEVSIAFSVVKYIIYGLGLTAELFWYDIIWCDMTQYTTI